MAQGLLTYAKSFNICYVNGYKFHINKRATRKTADISGVCVKAGDGSQDGHDFYGRLEEIIELEYSVMPIKIVT